MKVSLDARFSRKLKMRRNTDELAGQGCEVTSRWFRGGHEWAGADDGALPVEVGARFAWEEDIDAADRVVVFTEAPRSGPSRSGRHVEFGSTLALGKPIIDGHRENVFCLSAASFAPDWESIKERIVAELAAAEAVLE